MRAVLRSARRGHTLCVVMVLAGCSGDAAREWVRAAEAAHARADELEGAGEPAAAQQPLKRWLDTDAPEGVEPRDERVLRQDAFYRVARLALQGGDAEGALRFSEHGLALGTGARDVYVANLFIARGQAREALGAPVDAAADYHEALQINDELLQVLLPAAIASEPRNGLEGQESLPRFFGEGGPAETDPDPETETEERPR